MWNDIFTKSIPKNKITIFRKKLANIRAKHNLFDCLKYRKEMSQFLCTENSDRFFETKSMRKRLIDLLLKSDPLHERDLDDDLVEGEVEAIADYLLDNGIIVPPVKVGQTVWVCNPSKNNIYKNKVVCVKIVGTSEHKNHITVEHHNQCGESSCRKYHWSQIGKQVFLTEPEAIEALAECLRKGATDD